MRPLISCEQRSYVRSLTANRGQSEHWDPPGNSLVWPQMRAFIYGIIELGYMRTTAANELPAAINDRQVENVCVHHRRADIRAAE